MRLSLIVLLLIVVVLVSMVKTEQYSKASGFAGYHAPSRSIVIDDPQEDLSKYTEQDEKISLTNDQMEAMVLATNKYISERTKMCTYIIETISVKKFKPKIVKSVEGSVQEVINKGDVPKKDLYKAMFLVVKHGGYSIGFSVTVDLQFIDDTNVKVLSAHTQPIDIDEPLNKDPYLDRGSGKVFMDYNTVKKSELDFLKNNLL